MKYKCQDFYRYNESDTVKHIRRCSPEVQWLYYFRKLQCNRNKILQRYYLKKFHYLSKITQIQIPVDTQIGEGFYIGHTGRVIVNGDTVLGRNINIATGVTVGGGE